MRTNQRQKRKRQIEGSVMHDPRSIEIGENEQENNAKLNKMHRRRNFQRQACVISVMAAFVIGLSLGVFVPVIGLGTAISTEFNDRQLLSSRSLSTFDVNSNAIAGDLSGGAAVDIANSDSTDDADLHYPTTFDVQSHDYDTVRDSYAVTFVRDRKGSTKYVSSKHKNDIDYINPDKINEPNNGHLLMGHLMRDRTRKTMAAAPPPPLPASSASSSSSSLPALTSTPTRTASEHSADGKHVNGFKPSYPFVATSLKRLNKGNGKKVLHIDYANEMLLRDRPTKTAFDQNNAINSDDNPFDVIDDNIFWGKIIEDALPVGFSTDHVNSWNDYVQRNAIVRLEVGCGRMQNRLVTFQDGRKGCARYRQNTDQIQGELFSFYLGRLLNLTNLAPSTASIIDINASPWLSAAQDIQTAQWKIQRPVVLTDWVPDLEAANIPALFQPMERHLNKMDVKNITLGLDVKPPKSLLHHLGGSKPNPNWNQLPVGEHPSEMELNKTVQQKLVELAQWSDLIVFDYLIANLDRVVNNLYNFQWNADIMTAPAHNLARQSQSQLLVFLDNESGLLHGFRLLKKYETYHGLLLDNLCVFRRPTIEALQQLQSDGIGKRLQQLFEQSTSDKVRDVLPSLPDKSIKILVDRIDRVLGQVQKCRELFSKR